MTRSIKHTDVGEVNSRLVELIDQAAFKVAGHSIPEEEKELLSLCVEHDIVHRCKMFHLEPSTYLGYYRQKLKEYEPYDKEEA